MKLKLNEPKVITFLIAVVLAVVAVILFLTPTSQAYAIWVMLVAFVLLAAGNLVKGL
jgi:hypothetical protein